LNLRLQPALMRGCSEQMLSTGVTTAPRELRANPLKSRANAYSS